MVNERCPKLGERSETLFIAAIATTLSLSSGGQSLPSEDDRDALVTEHCWGREVLPTSTAEVDFAGFSVVFAFDD